jgi:hypothetical protein
MGQSNLVLDKGGSQRPHDLPNSGGHGESQSPSRPSWLILVLMIAMVVSFALVWFLSTPY